MNSTYHMILLQMAFNNMTPQVQQKVTQILQDPNNPEEGGYQTDARDKVCQIVRQVHQRISARGCGFHFKSPADCDTASWWFASSIAHLAFAGSIVAMGSH